jgi:hypothetical protein
MHNDLLHLSLQLLIISRYYGEYVNQADIYIGFGHPHLCDIPGLVTSNNLCIGLIPRLETF